VHPPIDLLPKVLADHVFVVCALTPLLYSMLPG
jgi:hypothetical protein